MTVEEIGRKVEELRERLSEEIDKRDGAEAEVSYATSRIESIEREIESLNAEAARMERAETAE